MRLWRSPARPEKFLKNRKILGGVGYAILQ